ncbi:CD1247 N-terminal domain-containing protein [Gehongia tenuis]|uniref:Uncharacterized protein n=1 Tax=Gehongia tenuis TaxID=2763655 RepID=A0A926HPF3_9FIRM|nr:CD1247 N-terminal domain-containing protein [Gehongia tenuis]MBC8531153.1 hypothetical protein [Gehongia tenuis]
MDRLQQRVARLKGMLDAVELDHRQDMVMRAIVDILDEMALSLAEVETVQSELEEYVQDLDDDLVALEEEMSGEASDGETEREPDETIEIECPHCKEHIRFEENAFLEADQVECPNCHHVIYTDED